ncbi:hypothetical protein BIV60_17155 [Bacillus sp. MUM 116]|uniref:hypothetical protein n=1 Tax=Bacillus sp. MUM 116 TaxID=1678002 RepID=UPI0008F5D06F|nr:hypothetical protein [Bacillus sp. MUM 116]OIK11981.1 hypothetical protein BIV60_17155 [Bacillus sp. MUM 116]
MYTVLNDFTEKEHKNTLYIKGEKYPKKGFKADSKRIIFLQSVHPGYGVAFLEIPVEPPERKSKANSKAVESND